MRIYAIRDELHQNIDLAYLTYYEKSKTFYIDVNDEVDIWEMPLIISSFAEKGIKTIDPTWSKIWVQQRIVSKERQNINSILKNSGMAEYDEFKLLTLSEGRCVQDDCYIVELFDMPKLLVERKNKKIFDFFINEKLEITSYFIDGTVMKTSFNAMVDNHEKLKYILMHKDVLNSADIQVGGNGICWSENEYISSEELWQSGKKEKMSLDMVEEMMGRQLMTTSEACDLLDCSRQYIDELEKKGKLKAVKSVNRTKLFLKRDLLERLWV